MIWKREGEGEGEKWVEERLKEDEGDRCMG